MDFCNDYLNILGLFLAMPNTAADLVVKAFAIIAIGFAGRGIECFDMDWEQILRTTMDDGSHRVSRETNRTKFWDGIYAYSRTRRSHHFGRICYLLSLGKKTQCSFAS